MGDLVKKQVNRKSLKERAAERDVRRQEAHAENDTIAYLSGEKKTDADILLPYQKSKNPPRERTISARVNGDIFDRFKVICAQKNMTANAGLNMLIELYVKQSET